MASKVYAQIPELFERHYAQFLPQHSSRKVLRVLEGGKRNGNRSERRDRYSLLVALFE